MSAILRLLTTAAHSSVFDRQDLPQNSAQYAADSTTDGGLRADGPSEDNLYTYTAEASEDWGGIDSTWGSSPADFDLLNGGPSGPQPNAQKSLNGSLSKLEASLRILADRLSTESDDLTRDQENYGAGSNLKEAHMFEPQETAASGLEDLVLDDPQTCSTYSRENNVNNNSTENKLLSSFTADDPPNEVGDGLDMQGQEGMTEIRSADVHDGDFDNHGYRAGDRLLTQDPDTDGYYNVHSGSRSKKGHRKIHPLAKEPKSHRKTKHRYPDDLDDPTWEFLALEEDDDDEHEVEADADPRLWNMAQQPLGQAG